MIDAHALAVAGSFATVGAMIGGPLGLVIGLGIAAGIFLLAGWP